MAWRILVVDDEPVNLEIIAEYLDDAEFDLVFAADGELGWQALSSAQPPIDLVLLDRMMPRVSGMELLRWIKREARFAEIPVIMQTAANLPEQVREGIAAGAYYYLTKPYHAEELLGIVRGALAELQDRRAAAAAVDAAGFALAQGERVSIEFRSLQQARELAGRLASLCGDPPAAALGLTELLVNAVEHGNLEISYAQKKTLRQADGWEEEIERRLADPRYAGRQARVSVERQGEDMVFTISDEGPGFDWRRFLTLDPERAFDPNGRGIALAGQIAFHALEYQGRGNIVTARVAAVRGGAR